MNFAIEIRDAAIERLKRLGRYAPPGRPDEARIRRTPVMPPQIDDVPCLLVYLGRKTMTPPGDGNHSAPHFVDEIQIVICSVIPADDADDLDDRMAEAGEEILETLLEDPTWQSPPGEPKRFEAVTGVTQQARFDQQEYLAAVVVTTLSLTYRTTWPPRVDGIFEGVQMRTPDAQLGADYPVPTP